MQKVERQWGSWEEIEQNIFQFDLKENKLNLFFKKKINNDRINKLR